MDIPQIKVFSASVSPADSARSSQPPTTEQPTATASSPNSRLAADTKPSSTSLNPAYRTIQLEPGALASRPETPITWRPAVGFDSIPLVLNSDDPDIIQERDESPDDVDTSGFLSIERTGRGRSLSPYGPRSLSPARHRSPSPHVMQFLSGGSALDGVKDGYPRVPPVDLESFLFTKETPGYQKYVKSNAKRVILCYLTGRRHTWVALDYIVAKLLRQGDHLVIISRIPELYKDEIFPHDDYYYKVNFRPRGTLRRNKDRLVETSEKMKDRQNVFRKIMNDMTRYIELIAPENSLDKMDIKLTMDFYVENSTREIIDKSIDIYLPTMLVVTSKPNLRFTRSTSWKSSRMSDRLMKNFELPMIVVPSLTLNQFEIDLFEQVSKKTKVPVLNLDQLKPELIELDKSYSTNPSLTSLMRSRKNSSSPNGSTLSSINKKPRSGFSSTLARSEQSSIVSLEDSDSDSDEDSSSMTSSVKDLTQTISANQEILDAYCSMIDEVDLSLQTNDTFLNKLNKVMDSSKQISKQFESISEKDDGSNGADLIRTLTGRPKIYKTRSMLDDFEDFSSRDASRDPINRLKKSLNASSIDNLNKPSMHDSVSVKGPKAIKFSSDINSPDTLKQQTKQGLIRFQSYADYDGSRLAPSKSAERNKLTKSKSESRVGLKSDYSSSTPQSPTSGGDDDQHREKKKKKKGLFTKLFGRG